MFRAGDVLYGKLRPYLNKVCIPPFDGICSTDFLVFPQSQHLDSRILMWYLNRRELVEFAAHQQRGVELPRVNYSDLADLPFPLPPLAEQRRIAEKVESLLAGVNASRDRLQRVSAILKRFRQAVLAAACSGRLTADWREDSPRLESAARLVQRVLQARGNPSGIPQPLQVGDMDLGGLGASIPEMWTWVCLRLLMNPDEAFCYGVVQPGDDDDEGVALVRAGDLKDGRVNVDALRRIPRDVDAAYKRSRLRGGELLVTVVGAGIGEVGLAQAECSGFNIARAVAKIPVREFDARYVFLWMSTGTAMGWMKNQSREVARPTLNLEQLRQLPVPLPPLAEQHEIVRRVDALFALADAIEQRVAAAGASAERLTQAVLAKAFRGELVPQDPSDEPASVLLERIRQERKDLAPERPSAARIRRKRVQGKAGRTPG